MTDDLTLREQKAFDLITELICDMPDPIDLAEHWAKRVVDTEVENERLHDAIDAALHHLQADGALDRRLMAETLNAAQHPDTSTPREPDTAQRDNAADPTADAGE